MQFIVSRFKAWLNYLKNLEIDIKQGREKHINYKYVFILYCTIVHLLKNLI